MVEIDGAPAQRATVTTGQQDVLIGLAVEDVELVVQATGIGPRGPRGSWWWAGVGIPMFATGVLPHDMYLDTTTGDVWQYIGESTGEPGPYGTGPYGGGPYGGGT